jgi:hypothetical protein
MLGSIPKEAEHELLQGLQPSLLLFEKATVRKKHWLYSTFGMGKLTCIKHGRKNGLGIFVAIFLPD